MFADYSDSATGDIWHYDNFGIRYYLSADEIKTLFPSYVPYGNSYLLGTNFKVKIKEIDEEGNVYLSAVSCSITNDDYKAMDKRSGSLSSHADRLENELHAALKAGGKKPLVRAKATRVEKDRIFVDIFDTGIVGVIPVKNYAKQWNRNLQDCVDVGDELKGVIIAYRAREGEEPHFLMSTADYLPNPWIKALDFRKDSLIVLKCVEKVDEPAAHRQYFWGVSKMLPNIDIMADFTNKVPSSSVIEGHYYKCKITEVNVREHKIKVSPFAEVPSYGNGMDSIM